ncbi:uncharacterized protein [Drosophila kikkawai]|uniref:CHK kinase-like domain-containing protein n=1 Tax=Drosophila kikkawai TaxID=30033 RepID=A0A6P4I6Z6_DROKI|nr:uncharacterized protein LOC108072005 [Drosophila kikkawai]
MSESTDNIAYNDDELAPPEWLDSNFITGVLSNYEKAPELQVTDLSFSPACLKGEHYASIMFRAKVKYSTENGDFEKSLIIKTMPEEEGHKKDLIGSSPLFETEVGMYSKVLPEFERILRQAGDHTKLCADCIYHSLEPRKILIFEDLKESGYFVVRNREVSQEEVDRAFFKLAKWHAASLKVQEEQPHFLEEYTNGLFEMPQIMQEPFMKTGMPFFVDLLTQEPELNKYKSYFESIKPDFLERLTAEWKDLRDNPKVDQYRVLCHGDLHLRNIMFQYEEGTFKDCMLLDFQISHLFPLTTDLIYSIYMLMEPEQRGRFYEDFIYYYIFVLTNTLEEIGYKGEMPTVEGLYLNKHKYYEFFFLTTFLPLMWALRETSVDFGELLQDDERRRQCYFSKGYIKDVQRKLLTLDICGYFKDV